MIILGLFLYEADQRGTQNTFKLVKSVVILSNSSYRSYQRFDMQTRRKGQYIYLIRRFGV